MDTSTMRNSISCTAPRPAVILLVAAAMAAHCRRAPRRPAATTGAALAPAPVPPSIPLVPLSVSASSFINNPQGPLVPANAFDDDPTTAWNESAPGPGPGEWLQADFGRPVTVRRVRMATGWDYVSPRNGDLFPQNAHLWRVRLRSDTGATILERDIGATERELDLQGFAVQTRTLRIEAVDVWRGTRWQDLCISDIHFEGNRDDLVVGQTRAYFDASVIPNPGHARTAAPAERTVLTLVLIGEVNRRLMLGVFEQTCTDSGWALADASVASLRCSNGTDEENFAVFQEGENVVVRAEHAGGGDVPGSPSDMSMAREVAYLRVGPGVHLQSSPTPGGS